MKLPKFKEGDDAKIFMITFEKLLQTATLEEKAYSFQLLYKQKLKTGLKEKGEDQDFTNMRKVFVAEFRDKILVTCLKAKFINIKSLQIKLLPNLPFGFTKKRKTSNSIAHYT